MAQKPLIRILHLSDAHFRVGRSWDADPVLRSLTRFIQREVQQGLAPDLVIFTGDLAFSGNAHEYELAKEWLEKHLWPSLSPNLPRDRLLIIPGNHDVDRKKIGKSAMLVQEGLLQTKSQDDIAEVLGEEDEHKAIIKRHEAYLEFAQDWYGEPQPFSWWQKSISVRGKIIHVAGINSAWMSSSDQDRGRLLLGKFQINQTINALEKDSADWRIVMIHHPFDYFAEFESQRNKRQIYMHADLLLRGHLHEQQSERILPPDPNRQCLELAAGCIYESSSYPNAFQWIELGGADKRVVVRYRTWAHDDWTVDRNQPNCPEGSAKFHLVGLRNQSVSKPKARCEVPALYCNWLRKRYARVELLGQEAAQGQSIVLSQVYVPATTQPTSKLVEDDLANLMKPDKRSLDRVWPLGEEEDDDDDDTKPEIEDQRPALLLDRLNESSLFVYAAAGSGKSTFCRWAALHTISQNESSTHSIAPPSEFAEQPAENLLKRLPLLVPLREFAAEFDYAHGHRRWDRRRLERTIAKWIDRNPPPGLTGALFLDHVVAGTALLMFDGLDEVAISEARGSDTIYPRELLLSGLSDAVPEWEKAGNRILITSRPYGLEPVKLAQLGLEQVPLLPLTRDLQQLFIVRWFHTLGKLEVAGSLQDTMSIRTELDSLFENPLLLTALCILYNNGGQLPEDSYELYRSIVNVVLHSRFAADAREREPVLRRLEAIAYGMHTGGLSSVERNVPVAEISWVEAERLLANFAQLNPAYERGQVTPAIQREELLHRTGLLVPRPNERLGFYHLSFQEFLAAQRIARIGSNTEQVFRERGRVVEWRPTLLFLFAAELTNKDPRWGLRLIEDMILDLPKCVNEIDSARATLIAEAMELCIAKGYKIPGSLTDLIRNLAFDAFDAAIDVHARQALGLALGWLGDPRIEDLHDSHAYVHVSSKSCGYSGTKDSPSVEAGFEISRYPVTNSQYETFMNDGGYERKEWWPFNSWQWLKYEGISEPLYWKSKHLSAPNLPVVGISYWEALACARWAGGRLPSLKEWCAAAYGNTEFQYPWGDTWIDGVSNCRDTGIGRTSPVGSFVNSRNSLGLDDLIGNVFEWLQVDPVADVKDRSVDARFICSGGGYQTASASLQRDAIYSVSEEYARQQTIGFRVLRLLN